MPFVALVAIAINNENFPVPSNQNFSALIKLKLNEPQHFNSAQNFLVLNKWLNKGEKYFNLVHLAEANDDR